MERSHHYSISGANFGDDARVVLGNTYIDAQDKDDRCRAGLRSTDPRHDKARIEQTKGGLLLDSYCWVLDSAEFQHWREDEQTRLLWIKGDPGKGKTMLLCGIINHLGCMTKLEDEKRDRCLSFFFCQATDMRINNTTAVLRGLAYLLVEQQPLLISHVRKKYDHVGDKLFEGVNAWVAASEILAGMLNDPRLQRTYLIIDALDECEEEQDRTRLLRFIVQNSTSSRLKWIVSSRNIPGIEQELRLDQSQARLSLEIRENADKVSRAVDIYIDHCISELPDIRDDDRALVRQTMQEKANGTFLWVSLVAQELSKADHWDVKQIIEETPPGLEEIYGRMLDQINRLQRENPVRCRMVLATVTTTYRPLNLEELGVLSGLTPHISQRREFVARLVAQCGSFLTVRDEAVYIVHQSAQEFLSKHAFGPSPDGIRQVHHGIFSRSLDTLSQTLRRDIYGLRRPGFHIDKVTQPEPDPLAKVRYSCIYWVDHLHYCCTDRSAAGLDKELRDGGSVYEFLSQKYLYWLEALSLLRSMSEGVLAMTKLQDLLQGRKSQLADLIQDERRFIQYHRFGIENTPLQVYASALIFSPACSITRNSFRPEEPKWVLIKPPMEDDWDACLQTLEGHDSAVVSVAFSPDGRLLASTSSDDTIRLWDPTTGAYLQTLKNHDDLIISVTFSPDGRLLASTLDDYTIRLWDLTTGVYLQTLEGHDSAVVSVAFPPDGRLLASTSHDRTIRIWDLTTGVCLQTLEGYNSEVRSVTFSPDGRLLALILDDYTIRLWDLTTGVYLQTLEGYDSLVISVAFSPDGRLLASASHDHTIRIWDLTTGVYIRMLRGHSGVRSVAFSPDGRSLATASLDGTARLWDMTTDICNSRIIGRHAGSIFSVAFSPDGRSLATASIDRTARLWDITTDIYNSRIIESHSYEVSSVAFSPNGSQLAIISQDHTARLWDTATGRCIQTFRGHNLNVRSAAFSPNGRQLAITSEDNTARLWDTATGRYMQTIERYNNIGSATFSPNGRQLATASDNTARLWDTTTGKCIQTLRGHNLKIWSAAFSPNGRQLATASYDKTARLWDTTTGKCIQIFRGHEGHIISVAFSPNGRQVATASDDKTARLWDTTRGTCIQTFRGHEDYIRVAFSPDGRLLASVSSAQTIRLWNTATGVCGQPFNNSSPVHAVSFDHTGSYLCTGAGDIALDQVPEVLPPATFATPQHGPSEGVLVRPQGYGIRTNFWITWNGEDMLWLPPEYRPERSAMSGSKLAISCSSGRVLIFEFNPDGPVTL